MISNFRFQLGNLGKLDQLPAVLEEVSRVRAEFGYPIMVTPYSQFFGVQAAINVMVGERYQQVTDEVLLYALGFWGEEEAASIEPNVKDRLLATARAKELAKTKAPKMTVKQFRGKFGGPGVSDDDAILRFFAGEEYVDAMKAAGPIKEYQAQGRSLVALIEELAKRKESNQVYLKRGALTLQMRRHTGQ